MSDIKQRFRELQCRLFGHIEVEEVWADREILFDMFHKGPIGENKPLYVVKRRVICKRCGKEVVEEEWLTEPLRRSELLKQGWFINKNQE